MKIILTIKKYIRIIKKIKLKYLFNQTIYKGKLKFYYIKEDPYWSNGKECINGVIVKYKDKYFVTRIEFEKDKNFGVLYNKRKINKILKKCNVKIKTQIYNFNSQTSINEYDYFKYIDKKYLGEDFMVMYTLINKSNKYLGDLEHGYWLLKNNLVADDVEKIVAYNSKSKKYIGFSHGAAVYFGIGDKIFEENYGDDNTLYTQHGSKTITTLEEAKQAAYNFGKYVS